MMSSKQLMLIACVALLTSPCFTLPSDIGATTAPLLRAAATSTRLEGKGLIKGLKGGSATHTIQVQEAPVITQSGSLKSSKSFVDVFFDAQNIAVFLVLATAGSFYQVKSTATGTKTSATADENANYVLGLLIAGIALVGNAAVGALRKLLSQHNVGSAQQVGLASLIQGIVAIGYCVYTGVLEVGPNFVKKLPPSSFWGAAVGASVLNSVVKTLETKAFAESDMSLCAPFLAFDPVMQFVVGVLVMPMACKHFGLGCDELKKKFPPYHLLSVICIAYGAFLLGKGPKGGVAARPVGVKYLGPLPVGSWYILLNCVIYAFTSRMDKLAIKSAGKTLYYAYGRMIMASTTLGGSLMSGGLNKKELSKFATSQVMGLILAICLADAVYMLSLYQAFAMVSPVYVTAIKRGGGILLSSLLGVLLFGESVKGRMGPIVTICIGVTFLCL